MRLATLLAALWVAIAAPSFAHDGVHINQPYASIIGANAKSGAVYMLIVNHAASDDVLLSASTDAAKSTMLHQSVQDANGVMQMPAMAEGIIIPGKGQFTFEHSGYHIMLMGLTRSFAPGDTFKMTLTFQNAGAVEVEVPVTNDLKSGDAMEGMEGMDHAKADTAEHAEHANHGTPAVDTAGLPDDQAIITIMKAQFDTPENPLTVDPVIVQGDHALASWAQADKGGRALLERREGVWVIVMCGGPDLRMPTFLTENGVAGADTLSSLFNAAEDKLGTDKVALSSSFEGNVMIAGPSHSN